MEIFIYGDQNRPFFWGFKWIDGNDDDGNDDDLWDL